MNNKDHLVGQLTREDLYSSSLSQALLSCRSESINKSLVVSYLREGLLICLNKQWGVCSFSYPYLQIHVWYKGFKIWEKLKLFVKKKKINWWQWAFMQARPTVKPCKEDYYLTGALSLAQSAFNHFAKFSRASITQVFASSFLRKKISSFVIQRIKKMVLISLDIRKLFC